MAVSLRERLSWAPEEGSVQDGPRRYLLMRPDVLMGAVVALPPAAQQPFLQAFSDSARRHGAASLQAYAEQVKGDTDALVAATLQAAADLGWGLWKISRAQGSLTLTVQHSPFAAGWRAAGGGIAPQPVCAPIRGMFAGLAGALAGHEVRARECGCAATRETFDDAPTCEFVLEEAP